jgi:hypothetical protein
MSIGRFTASVFAGFVLSQILAVLVHGFILAGDYEPFRGNLLRTFDTATWQAIFLPIAHLSFVFALVWVYGRARLKGPAPLRGLKLGIIGWAMGQVPLWLIWYAEQPWPGALVVKQLGLEFLSVAVIGIAIAAIAGEQRSSRSPSTVS